MCQWWKRNMLYLLLILYLALNLAETEYDDGDVWLIVWLSDSTTRKSSLYAWIYGGAFTITQCSQLLYMQSTAMIHHVLCHHKYRSLKVQCDKDTELQRSTCFRGTSWQILNKNHAGWPVFRWHGLFSSNACHISHIKDLYLRKAGAGKKQSCVICSVG